MLIRRGYQSIHPGRRVQERNYSGTNYVNVLCFFETRNAYMVSFIFFFYVHIRSVDDQIFDTAISLAERYDISKWEMFMSHLEWLFTDSE